MRNTCALDLEMHTDNQAVTTASRSTRSVFLTAMRSSAALLREPNFANGMQQALVALGTTLDCKRISLIQTHNFDEDDPKQAVRFQWRLTENSVPTPTFRQSKFDSSTVSDRMLKNQVKLTFPIEVSGQIWGALVLQQTIDAHSYTDHERETLKEFAATIGAAIERDRVEQVKLDQLGRRHQLSEAITLAIERLTAEPDLQTGLGYAAQALCQDTGIDRVFIASLDYQSFMGVLLIERRAAGVVSVIPLLNDGAFQMQHSSAAAFLQGKPTFTSTADMVGEHRVLNQQLGTMHEVMVPILVAGEVWGCIGFDNCSTDVPFTQADAQVLRASSAGITAAIQRDAAERTRLEAARVASEQLLAEQSAKNSYLSRTNEVLSKSMRALADHATLAAVVEEIARLLVDVLGGEAMTVLQLSGAHADGLAERIDRCIALDQGILLSNSEIAPCFQPSNTIDSQPATFSNQRPVLTPLKYDTPDSHFLTASVMRNRGYKWLVNFPLWVGEKPAWNLCVTGVREDCSSDSNFDLFMALAQQLKLALELKRLGEEGAERAVLADRARLAGEIHDSLAQAFTGTLLLMRAARDAGAVKPTLQDDFLRRAELLIQEGLAQSRRSVLALRPHVLENASLPEALALLARKASVPGYIDCRYEGPERCGGDLQGEHEDELFRIAQEAIQNALKHASASRIDISYSECAKFINLSINDDGVGFTPASQQSQSGGLGQMQRRAKNCNATFEVASRPEHGTRITLCVSKKVNLK
jgi:signal transduction histidine kinase